MVVDMVEMTSERIEKVSAILATGKRVWLELEDSKVYECVFAKGIKFELKKRGASRVYYIGENVKKCWHN